jgi:hypothetical protein
MDSSDLKPEAAVKYILSLTREDGTHVKSWCLEPDPDATPADEIPPELEILLAMANDDLAGAVDDTIKRSEENNPEPPVGEG